jgi:hypothetical protein
MWEAAAMADKVAEESGGTGVRLQRLLLCPMRKHEVHFIGSRHWETR